MNFVVLLIRKNLTKKDQERIKGLLSRYITEIRCNMPFFINQYKEETANVVQRARAEIDAALQGFCYTCWNKGIRNTTQYYSNRG